MLAAAPARLQPGPGARLSKEKTAAEKVFFLFAAADCIVFRACDVTKHESEKIDNDDDNKQNLLLLTLRHNKTE